MLIDAVVSEHRVHPARHRMFADELPRSARLPSPSTQARWVERIKPLTLTPDADLAVFIAGTVVHAVVHEAANDRPELLDHPLLVPELVRLLDGYLSGGESVDGSRSRAKMRSR